jgi:hypothetical protein
MSPLKTDPSLASSDGSLQRDGGYQDLIDQLAKTKDLAQKMDGQIRDSRALYLSAVSGTKENIKRLEAHLEWEMRKWDKYQGQKDRMVARDNGGPISTEEDIALKNSDETESSEKQAMSGSDQEVRRMDKPIEARSINSIRDIQRLLDEAKVSLARLEEDNLTLFERRRTLNAKLKALEESYNQTATRRVAVEVDRDVALEELKTRTRNIEECKAAMEQEQVESQKVVGDLQTMIGTLMESTHIPGGEVAYMGLNGDLAPEVSPLTIPLEGAPASTFALAPVPVLTSESAPALPPVPAPEPTSGPSTLLLSVQGPVPSPSPGIVSAPASASASAPVLVSPTIPVAAPSMSALSVMPSGENVPTNFIELLTKNING